MTRLVVVGDTHIGSVYGLASRSSVPQDRDNAWLKWVFEVWSDFCSKYENPDYLLLIGDLADGSQVLTLGVDALVTGTEEQCVMAKDLLSMLIGDKTKIYGINGSGYHGGERQATNMDKRIIELLGGEYKGALFEFEVGNEKIQMSHGGAGSSIMSLHAYILREISLSKMDAQKRKIKGATILLRGHQHRAFAVQEDAGIWGILNGCWQYSTPFMIKKSANISPSIGATIIDIENGTTKTYRVDYPIPEVVRNEMSGHEVLKEKNVKRKREKDQQNWEKTLKERKY